MAKCSNDIKPGMIVIFSEGGRTARMVAKYRPSVPVLVVSSSKELAQQCEIMFGLHSMVLDAPVSSLKQMKDTVKIAILHGRDKGLCMAGKEVVVVFSTSVTSADQGKVAQRQVYITTCPGELQMNRLGSLAPSSSAQVSDRPLACVGCAILMGRVLVTTVNLLLSCPFARVSTELQPRQDSEPALHSHRSPHAV